jgi:ligand-binding sensor domain-containing protein/signal transduction histidine kinase/CheY-like chemotaxis protein
MITAKNKRVWSQSGRRGTFLSRIKARMRTVMLFLLPFLPLHARDISMETDLRLNFKYISVNSGLSQNSVTSIVQDKNGILLFGTYDGINFYDGYKVDMERYVSDRPDGLFNNRIVCMKQRADGNIWIGLDGGLALYDSDHKKYLNYTDSLGALRSNWTRAMEEDRNGNLWLGTYKDLVVGTNRNNSFSFSFINGFSPVAVYTLCCDRQGNMWVGTSNGVFVFTMENSMQKMQAVSRFKGRMTTHIFCDRAGTVWIGFADGLEILPAGSDTFRALPFASHAGIAVECILEDQSGNIWIGTGNEGLFRLTLENFRITNTIHYGPSYFFGRLSDNNVPALYVDRSNVLWVGTRKGINYASLASPNIYTFKPLLTEQFCELGYKGKHINILFIDSRDQLWISTHREGLYRYDLRKHKLTDMSSTITDCSLSGITETADGSLWFASQEAVYRIENPRPGVYRRERINTGTDERDALKHFQYFTGICTDVYNNVWIATIQGLICYCPGSRQYSTYLSTDGLTSDSPYCLLSDSVNRTLWVGSSDRGLSKIDYGKDGITHIENLRRSKTRHTISHDQVWCLFKSRKGTVWVGTDAGLNRIEISGSEILSATPVHVRLLKDIKIQAITEDAAGHLWLNSSQGLYCYDLDSQSVRCYNNLDGLQSNTYTSAAAISSNGWIFVGGINGIDYFNPALFRESSYTGHPILTQLRIFNTPIEPSGKYNGRQILDREINAVSGIVLNCRQNNFVLEFTSDHYVIPEKNRFRYRLRGYNPKWIEVNASQRYAAYENLPAGNYEFLLQSSNSDGVWSDAVKSLQITILPPPWLTWWAYLAYVLMAAGIGWTVFSYFRSKQRWKRDFFIRETEQRKKEELNEMKLNFYTNITHELRTPLSLIMAPLRDLVKQQEGDEYARFRLKIITDNAHKLLNLINQLLDIRRSSEQTLPLAISCHNIHAMVKSVVDSFCYQSEQAGIYLHFIPPNRACKGWFDLEKIEKVLCNLVSNAFKFTPPNGNIEVRLWTQEEDGRQFAFVSVKDSGIGIASNEQSKIFDLFYHGTPLRGDSSGVGLALSKTMMKLHGGNISVESEHNAGSNFIISFRIDRDAYRPEHIVKKTREDDMPGDENIPEDIPAQESPAVRDKYTVLIVEDNDDMRMYIAECLKSAFRIITAIDGKEGLNMAQKLHPDIVITDMMMPRMDGFEFIRKMKSNPRTNYIPIIVHSVRNDRESIREAFVTGAQEYIVKPFEAESLIFRIGNQLNSRSYFARKLKSEEIMEPAEVEVPSRDREMLDKIRTIVEKNLSDALFGADQLAAELGMSRTQLYRRLKTLPGGKNISEIIRHIRIQRAAQLLSTGQLRVTEVMYEVGINNHYRFIHYFQEMYGMSPKAYIRQANSASPPDKTG